MTPKHSAEMLPYIISFILLTGPRGRDCDRGHQLVSGEPRHRDLLVASSTLRVGRASFAVANPTFISQEEKIFTLCSFWKTKRTVCGFLWGHFLWGLTMLRSWSVHTSGLPIWELTGTVTWYGWALVIVSRSCFLWELRGGVENGEIKILARNHLPRERFK